MRFYEYSAEPGVFPQTTISTVANWNTLPPTTAPAKINFLLWRLTKFQVDENILGQWRVHELRLQTHPGPLTSSGLFHRHVN